MLAAGIGALMFIRRRGAAGVKPVLPLLRRALPGQIVTTAQMGQATLGAVRHGAPRRVLEAPDIAALGRRG